ncbi:hypothetical protein EVAR_5054_1 [Eumeta japonica]|uniref:Uncharacterized protein n=1 Tax=Eumeta variegata TaxID=151549 RepID=A0A4C1SUV1_EUMVA|nr:hypothetical protein EVAR_5054_1 [Eumeta japonica]
MRKKVQTCKEVLRTCWARAHLAMKCRRRAARQLVEWSVSLEWLSMIKVIVVFVCVFLVSRWTPKGSYDTGERVQFVKTIINRDRAWEYRMIEYLLMKV